LNRSKLVLASLDGWSVVPLSLTLAGLIAIGLFVFPSLRITSSGGEPVVFTDPDFWLLIAFIAIAAFAYARALFWLIVSLTRRVRRSASQE
jgi:hypothetical protein